MRQPISQRYCLSNRIAELRVEDSRGVGRCNCARMRGTAERCSRQRGAALADGRAVVVRVRPRIEDPGKARPRFRVTSAITIKSPPTKLRPRKLYLLFLLLDRAIHSVRGHLDRAGSVDKSASRFRRCCRGHAGQEFARATWYPRFPAHAIDELATLVRAFNEMMHGAGGEQPRNSKAAVNSPRRFSRASPPASFRLPPTAQSGA